MSEKMREALRIALDALLVHGDERQIAGAVGALEFALAEQPDREKYSTFANSENSVETHTASKQPAQGEVVAVVTDCVTQEVAPNVWEWRAGQFSTDRKLPVGTKLYAAPPAPSVPDGLRAKLRSLALDLRRMVEKHPEHCGYITDRDQAMDWIAAEMAVLAAAPEPRS